MNNEDTEDNVRKEIAAAIAQEDLLFRMEAIFTDCLTKTTMRVFLSDEQMREKFAGYAWVADMLNYLRPPGPLREYLALDWDGRMYALHPYNAYEPVDEIELDEEQRRKALVFVAAIREFCSAPPLIFVGSR